MKKLFGLLLTLFAVFSLVACGGNDVPPQPEKLATPTNLVVNENNIATWDVVENAVKYRLNIVNEANVESKRVVTTNQADLNSFDLAYGVYTLYVQAMADKASGLNDSDYTTEKVSFELVEEIEIVTSLSGETLIDGNFVKWLGRTTYDDNLGLNLIFHSGSSFEVKVKGSQVTCELYATKYNNASARPYYVYMIDGNYETRVRAGLSEQYTTLTVDLPNDGKVHTFTLYKSSESTDSHMGLKSLSTDGTFIQGVEFRERKIEFIAASSSTGYGNLTTSSVSKTSENSDCMQAFSYYTASALNADMSIYSASGWGVKFSAWTSPNSLNAFDAYKYVDFSYYMKGEDKKWDITQFTPDVIVINFGTNDWSYIKQGKDANEKEQRMEAFINQYVDFLAYLHNIYPNCKIIMMYGLMGEKDIYAASETIYEKAKVNDPGLAIIKVVGDAKGSNSHPSVASHKKVSEDLVAKIKQEMGW